MRQGLASQRRGSKFTGAAWITALTEANVKISVPIADCVQSPVDNRGTRAVSRQYHP